MRFRQSLILLCPVLVLCLRIHEEKALAVSLRFSTRAPIHAVRETLVFPDTPRTFVAGPVRLISMFAILSPRVGTPANSNSFEPDPCPTSTFLDHDDV